MCGTGNSLGFQPRTNTDFLLSADEVEEIQKWGLNLDVNRMEYHLYV
jgi:hypothetical protein